MQIWKFLRTKLEQNIPAALLIVVHDAGSSPGRRGFKMAVSVDGEMTGSIGGGIMEHRLVDTAIGKLKGRAAKPFIKRQVHRKKSPDSSGMICSGEQTILFYPLYFSSLGLINNIINSSQGILTVASKNIKFEANANLKNNYNFTLVDNNNWSYSENINRRDLIYIIGAGHVGYATSKLFYNLGYQVALFDNRNNLNTFNQNEFVWRKQIIDYADIEQYIPENSAAYVTIMTNNYNDDMLILRKLIRKNFKYIGVMGSEAKIKQMFSVLKEEGFAPETMSQVFAPIGLPIHSRTPDEIAVSIAAQIIEIKNTT